MDDAFRGVVSVSGSQRGDYGEPDTVDKKETPCEAGTSTERTEKYLQSQCNTEGRVKSSAEDHVPRNNMYTQLRES